MNTQRDGFSGFLDGYKAQNLESAKDSASVKIKQMRENAENLIKEFTADKVSPLIRDVLPMDFSQKSLEAAGEGIKTLIIKDKTESIGLQKNNEFKRLVLNYMNIAQLYADDNIIDIALEAGDLLDN